MRCAYCNANLQEKTVRRQYCSAKCRKAAWQRKREDTLALVDEQLTQALRRVRALRGSQAA